MRTAIVEKALIPSENSSYAWFYDRESNWNQVCNTGLVLGALAIYEDEPERAQTIRVYKPYRNTDINVISRMAHTLKDSHIGAMVQDLR